LESRNGYLNIHKLGAVSRIYIRDYYGPLSDGLNVGLPSDRFQVDWHLSSHRVRRRLSGHLSSGPPADAHESVVVRSTPAGLLRPIGSVLDASAPVVRVEIPPDYQAIKRADPERALEWRMTAREVFEFYFAAGYCVVDAHSRVVDGERHSYYILQANYDEEAD
jgi:predicted GNAT superfamily acetyltransferase